MKSALALLALIAALPTLLACQNSAAEPSTQPDEPAKVARCETAIEMYDDASEFPDDYELIDDVIAWSTSNLQRGARTEDGRKFSKVGIGVRTRTDATVSVESDQIADGTRLTYGGSTGPRITFPSCEADGEWIVFAGGVWIDPEIDCFKLTVDAAGSSHSRKVGVGQDCP